MTAGWLKAKSTKDRIEEAVAKEDRGRTEENLNEGLIEFGFNEEENEGKERCMDR
ncbi:MAG: hypothetical protein ABIJ27_00365 [Candidatus Omnitrophota bacterium]